MKLKKFLLVVAALAVIAIIALPFISSSESQTLDETARQNASGLILKTPMGSSHVNISGPPNGEPVVLVHGFASPMYVWDKTAPALAAAGYRVIRFDLMGRGYSDKPDGSYDVAFFGQQINEILAALAISKPVNIVGYSMGGAVVSGYANSNPKRVKRIAFIAPFNTGKDIGPLGLPLVGDWLAKVVLAPGMPGRQRLNFYEPHRFPDAANQFREQMIYKGFTKAIHSSLKTIIANDHLQRYVQVGKSGKPLLLIWGKHDSVLPYEEHIAVRTALGEHTFLPLEKSGHAPALEQPKKVNAALLEWLASD